MTRTELRAEVEINAPAAHVYRVLTELARYEEWNPFYTSASGQFVVGERLKIEMSLPEGRSYLLSPRVSLVTENAELRWETRYGLSSLLLGEHFFQISPRSAGVTRVVQGDNYSGLLLRFVTKSADAGRARARVYEFGIEEARGSVREGPRVRKGA
jgi:hypothetical protein